MQGETTPVAPRDFSVRYEYWRQFDSLTIGDIAWMRHGIDPRLEDELPDWANSDLSHEIEMLVAAVHAGTVEVTDLLGGAGPKVSTRVKRNARLFDWLREKGWNTVVVGLDVPMPSQSGASTRAPVSRHAAQEAAILAELARQGHDPLVLPIAAPGKPGVKALVKKTLSGSTGLFAGATVFDKAWERLRASGAIN
ncbi:MAG: hypothetical protein IPF94_06435 [Betaproteobacteria bacterium]|nr:hypothetical protein [Betaproteobacteria bacterium]